eukprot:5583072-Amphidinium_carterae.2
MPPGFSVVVVVDVVVVVVLVVDVVAGKVSAPNPASTTRPENFQLFNWDQVNVEWSSGCEC